MASSARRSLRPALKAGRESSHAVEGARRIGDRISARGLALVNAHVQPSEDLAYRLPGVPQHRQMPMGDRLKDLFDERCVRSITPRPPLGAPRPRRARLRRDCLAGLSDLELTGRASRIADVMHHHLPQPFPEATRVIVASLGPRAGSERRVRPRAAAVHAARVLCGKARSRSLRGRDDRAIRADEAVLRRVQHPRVPDEVPRRDSSASSARGPPTRTSMSAGWSPRGRVRGCPGPAAPRSSRIQARSSICSSS